MAWLGHSRRANVLAALVRERRGKHGAQAAFELVLLERSHPGTHRVTRKRIRLVDILLTHLGVHNARMDGVCKDVGMLRRDMLVQVARVEDVGKLDAAVLGIRAVVFVELLDRRKVAI